MITHAIPNHKYFAIIQPASGKGYHQIMKENKDQVHELKDPKSGNIHKAIFIDTWIYKLDELKLMNAFTMLCFGKEAILIVNHLKTKFPELQAYESKCEIWLMKRI